ncbi:MAG TPA: hypothetical protein VFS52_22825 [Steroidobacteraceae bacterium]|nr:hypothetical protein [Steroidobacteraceae bacterium]
MSPSAPVAVAIARAKLAKTNTDQVLELYDAIIDQVRSASTPRGSFWRAAFHPNTLATICRIRQGLLGLRSDAAVMLRAIMLGSLHGPLAKTSEASYFSNQMPRMFAAKPDYAVRFLAERDCIHR